MEMYELAVDRCKWQLSCFITHEYYMNSDDMSLWFYNPRRTVTKSCSTDPVCFFFPDEGTRLLPSIIGLPHPTNISPAAFIYTFPISQTPYTTSQKQQDPLEGSYLTRNYQGDDLGLECRFTTAPRPYLGSRAPVIYPNQPQEVKGHEIHAYSRPYVFPLHLTATKPSPCFSPLGKVHKFQFTFIIVTCVKILVTFRGLNSH